MGTGDVSVDRERTPVVDVEYSVESDQSPVEAIIDAVEMAADVNPLESSPLYEYVDPDAIESLFRHQRDNNSAVLLCFKIETWTVFVGADGKIRVCDATQSISPDSVFE